MDSERGNVRMTAKGGWFALQETTERSANPKGTHQRVLREAAQRLEGADIRLCDQPSEGKLYSQW